MNTLKNKAGFIIRCAMVAFFTLGGLSMPLEYDPSFPIAVVFFFLAPALMVPVQFWFAMKMKRERTRNWSRPTWFTNPFSGPPQFFHTAAWAFMGMGLVATARALYSGRIVTSGLFPLCVGLGIYIGIRLFYAKRPPAAR